MGIDAEMVVKYRGEKPTDEQLTRWSWELCRAIGAKHFFVEREGLPPAQYTVASKAWHAAFNAHPAYAEYHRLSEESRASFLRTDEAKHTLAMVERDKIVADIGEYPKQMRRAIDFSCAGYDEDEWQDYKVPKEARAPGLVYFQDADPVFAAPGEWLLKLSLWTRYYGVGYERGDILTLCAIAEWIEVNMQPCEVWYGGDSSGVELARFDDAARRKLRAHLYGQQGRDYFSSWGTPPRAMPPKCGLCVPEEKRQQYGSGMNGNYAAVSCGGCGKCFKTEDAGATWTETKDD